MAEEPIVTTDWLAEHLEDPDVRAVDIRGYVTTRPVAPGVEEATYRGAEEEYLAGHIPGAVFIDWTADIVDPDDPVPAQLAKPDRFAEAMAARGIGPRTKVVAVDHLGGQFATRLWWALTYYGHDLAYVLDGGWDRWVEEGRPIEPGAVKRPRREFRTVPRASWRKTAEEVRSLPRPGLIDPASSTPATPASTPVLADAAREAATSPAPATSPASASSTPTAGSSRSTRPPVSPPRRASAAIGRSSPTATAGSRRRSCCSTCIDSDSRTCRITTVHGTSGACGKTCRSPRPRSTSPKGAGTLRVPSVYQSSMFTSLSVPDAIWAKSTARGAYLLLYPDPLNRHGRAICNLPPRLGFRPVRFLGFEAPESCQRVER